MPMLWYFYYLCQMELNAYPTPTPPVSSPSTEKASLQPLRAVLTIPPESIDISSTRMRNDRNRGKGREITLSDLHSPSLLPPTPVLLSFHFGPQLSLYNLTIYSHAPTNAQCIFLRACETHLCL